MKQSAVLFILFCLLIIITISEGGSLGTSLFAFDNDGKNSIPPEAHEIFSTFESDFDLVIKEKEGEKVVSQFGRFYSNSHLQRIRYEMVIESENGKRFFIMSLIDYPSCTNYLLTRRLAPEEQDSVRCVAVKDTSLKNPFILNPLVHATYEGPYSLGSCLVDRYTHCNFSLLHIDEFVRHFHSKTALEKFNHEYHRDAFKGFPVRISGPNFYLHFARAKEIPRSLWTPIFEMPYHVQDICMPIQSSISEFISSDPHL